MQQEEKLDGFRRSWVYLMLFPSMTEKDVTCITIEILVAEDRDNDGHVERMDGVTLRSAGRRIPTISAVKGGTFGAIVHARVKRYEHCR